MICFQIICSVLILFSDKILMRFSGYKLCLSFDEATVVGSDRYLTINVHHRAPILGRSRTAPLGLVRINDRATGENLKDIIQARLESFNLTINDFVAATTDAGSNVLKAVDLMMLRKQRCFVHGLDLVVRKVVSGKHAKALDVRIFVALNSETADSLVEDADEDPSMTDDTPDIDEEEDGGTEVVLGEAVKRLREAVRKFKKRPAMMDEVRQMTARAENNNKGLKPKLDSKTRWYSTLLMIERALEILPALNYVLSHHGTPISVDDASALREIALVLEPFKRAMLLLCNKEANLVHADKVFTVLISKLSCSASPVARMLLDEVKGDILKRCSPQYSKCCTTRITILSSRSTLARRNHRQKIMFNNCPV